MFPISIVFAEIVCKKVRVKDLFPIIIVVGVCEKGRVKGLLPIIVILAVRIFDANGTDNF